MNITRNISDFFRRGDRRAARNEAQPPATQAPEAPTTRPIATQPIPIGGARPQGLPLPLPAHLRDRSPSGRSIEPPPSQGSHGTPPPVYHSRPETPNAAPNSRPNSFPNSLLAPPPLSESPAPSFNRSLRAGETRLGLSDFGDRLGMEPSETGSVRTFNSNVGSMAGLYPASERGEAGMAGSPGSSLQAHTGHDRLSTGGSDSSSPIFGGFFAEMRRLEDEARIRAPEPPRPPDGTSGSPTA